MNGIHSKNIPNNKSNIHQKNMEGPDQILPTENYFTWVKHDPVKLRIGKNGPASLEPISIPDLLKKAAQKHPEEKALGSKCSNEWQFVNYRQYYENVRIAAKAFIKLGLQRFYGVCIIGFNSKEWLYSNLGAIFAGSFTAGIYTTSNAEACIHCAKDCQAQIFVVENEIQLEKVIKSKPHLPHLKAIIQYKGKPTIKGVLSWEEVMEMGKKENDDELEHRLKQIAINECCTLIYTSGTTGPPKGVMLSHDNLTWTAQIININNDIYEGSTTISYLPLSHIGAQIVDIYCSISAGGTTYFADPDALKGSLSKTLKEVQPTAFVAVPRVFEKMREKMLEIGAKTTGTKRLIATWAKEIGTKRSFRIQNNNLEYPFGYKLAKSIVFNNVSKALGFNKSNFLASVAAPLAKEVIEYFHSLDLPIVEGYGMSESTGTFAFGNPKCFKIGSVGKIYNGCYAKIYNADDEGNGEICAKGRQIFMGYLNMPEETIKVMDKEGFFHTGDMGKFDDDGFLYITGRFKELIITAGGENIPPVLIENELKKNLPCVSNAVLIGDNRKFLSVLLTLKTEVDEDQVPLDTLSPECTAWLQQVNCHIKYLSELIENFPDMVMKRVQEAIDSTNRSAVSNAQKIQKWCILPKDFSIAGGELGPTLKIKRQVIWNIYKDTIDTFYS